jgi:7,8-dihydroneopterin aldolase/epimerase/oxygenase
MATIALEGLRFKAPIGVYAEEKVLKNDIQIDLQLKVSTLISVEKLDDTINYEIVYQLIKAEVLIETDLLEDTLQRILHAVKNYCENNASDKLQLNSVSARIKKLSPPIKGNIAAVWIEDEFVNLEQRKKNAGNVKNSSNVAQNQAVGATILT